MRCNSASRGPPASAPHHRPPSVCGAQTTESGVATRLCSGAGQLGSLLTERREQQDVHRYARRAARRRTAPRLTVAADADYSDASTTSRLAGVLPRPQPAVFAGVIGGEHADARNNTGSPPVQIVASAPDAGPGKSKAERKSSSVGRRLA